MKFEVFDNFSHLAVTKRRNEFPSYVPLLKVIPPFTSLVDCRRSCVQFVIVLSIPNYKMKRSTQL